MLDSVIYLLDIQNKKNNVDELVEVVTKTFVYASIRSIGQREKYQAQAAGLMPEIKFVMAERLEYNGERHVEYDGQRYRVLSTYIDPKTGGIELTCTHIINPGGVTNANA